MWCMLRTFVRDERAQGMTEYALVLTLVAVIAAGVLALLGLRAKGLYESLLPFPG